MRWNFNMHSAEKEAKTEKEEKWAPLNDKWVILLVDTNLFFFWFSPAKNCLHGRWASSSTRKFKYYQHKDNPISLTVASWHHHLLFGWQARIYTRCGEQRKGTWKEYSFMIELRTSCYDFFFFIFQMVLCVCHSPHVAVIDSRACFVCILSQKRHI